MEVKKIIVPDAVLDGVDIEVDEELFNALVEHKRGVFIVPNKSTVCFNLSGLVARVSEKEKEEEKK